MVAYNAAYRDSSLGSGREPNGSSVTFFWTRVSFFWNIYSQFSHLLYCTHSMVPCKIRLFCVSDQISRHIGVSGSPQHQPVTDLGAQQKAPNAMRALMESAGVPNTLRETVFTPPILSDLWHSLPPSYFPLQKYRLNILNRTCDEMLLEWCPVINCEYNYRHPFYTSSLCKKISPNIVWEWIGSMRTWRKWKTPAEVMTWADGLVWLGWTPIYSF